MVTENGIELRVEMQLANLSAAKPNELMTISRGNPLKSEKNSAAPLHIESTSIF
jgi:hypothetical protein